jgi:hypothetical protein
VRNFAIFENTCFHKLILTRTIFWQIYFQQKLLLSVAQCCLNLGTCIFFYLSAQAQKENCSNALYTCQNSLRPGQESNPRYPALNAETTTTALRREGGGETLMVDEADHLRMTS